MSPATRTPAKKPAAPAPVTHPVGERRLLLLDGHSLAYRAFFALPAENFRTGTGQTTNAVYGFTAMLINLCATRRPRTSPWPSTSRAVTFRSERFADYKANRSKTPGRLPRAGRPHQGRADGAGHPVLRGRQLRGRRHHRHARHPGRGAGLPGADHHGRPRRVPADQRQRHGALPETRRLRARPDRPGRGDDPLRAHARRSTRTSRRCAATPATTCPASPASARRRPPSGCASSARSTSSPTGWTR